MLIQFSSISSLDTAAQDRLKQALASGLAFTAEAKQGYVVFEGKYLKLAEARSILSKQNLFE